MAEMVSGRDGRFSNKSMCVILDYVLSRDTSSHCNGGLYHRLTISELSSSSALSDGNRAKYLFNLCQGSLSVSVHCMPLSELYIN